LVYVTPGLTEEKFTAHLNSYCRRKWRTIEHAAFSSYFASIGFYIYSEIQQFGTPAGERGTVEHLLFEMKRGMREGEHLRAAEPAHVERLFAAYNETAQSLGLDECVVAGLHLPHPEA
jgi:hypothetical protein